MLGLTRVAVLSALAAILTACATYDVRYQFEPAPSVTAIARQGADEAAARTLVSVIGVRLADAEHPDEVEVRLRVEATAVERVRLEPDALRLVGGRLSDLPLTRSDPPAAVEATPGRAAEMTAWFRLPPDYDADEALLAGLLLDWRVTFPDGGFDGSSAFRQRPPAYGYWLDPYPYPIHRHRFHRHGWHYWGCY